MATEKHFQFFQYLFEQESAREKQLNDYAKNLISLTTLYSAFVIFVGDKLKDKLSGDSAARCLFVATVVTMLAGFPMTAWASRVLAYEALNDPEEVIKEFGESEPDDDEFYDNRIADCTAATNWNSDINDKKAKYLLWASYCLEMGIVLHAVFFLVAFA